MVWKLDDCFVLSIGYLRCMAVFFLLAFSIVADMACFRSGGAGAGNISVFSGLALFVAIVASAAGLIHVE